MVGLAMSGAHPSDAGLASGLVNTTQQVGGALGLSLLATLSTTRADDGLREGLAQTAALTEGYQLAFLVAAGLMAGAVVVAATVLRGAPALVAPEAEGAEDEERVAVAA